MMIDTPRLAIKPYGISDLPDLVALLTDERIKATFMIPDFPSAEAAETTARKLMAYALDEARFERGIYRDGCLIGFVCDVENHDGVIEIGYVIRPDMQNKGYATEALRAVIAHLFARGCREIVAGAFIENRASTRVMEKCAMTRLEREEEIEYRGKTRKCVYYSIRFGAWTEAGKNADFTVRA